LRTFIWTTVKIYVVRIASTNGNALEISVVGYQFPDAEDLAKRYSWHMLKGTATVAEASWHFRWQALTCDESLRVAPWLRLLAETIGDTSGADLLAPAPLIFTEPNLAFAALDLRSDRALLRIELDVEFHRDRAHWRAGEPYLLDLDVTGSQLVRAAAEWDREIARYPGKAPGP
jgi:hypothetical protein